MFFITVIEKFNIIFFTFFFLFSISRELKIRNMDFSFTIISILKDYKYDNTY